MSKASGIKCPYCDAPIEYDGSTRYLKCGYCGSTVEVTSENKIVFHSIDEAEVQRTKTDREVRLKELDAQIVEEKNDSEHQKKYRIIWGIVVVALIIAGLFADSDFLYLAFFAAAIGFFGKSIKRSIIKMTKSANESEEKRQSLIDAGYISIPAELSLKLFPTIKVTAAIELLKNAGFTNIHTVNLKDLQKNEKSQKDVIKKVLIEGKDPNTSDLYPPNANVEILYHDFPDEYYSNPVRLAISTITEKIKTKL